jgi:predicted lipoprotein with Yx(FWY)xxD motif
MFKLRNLVMVLLALLVVSPALAQSSTPTISLGDTKDFGKILVGKDGMTLYLFTADSFGSSVCNDQCAKAWPALTVDSADKLSVADGIPGKFDTFKRKDNTLQVTYNGMPLYYWFKDKAAGDTTGNRITRNWWVVPPATAYMQRLDKVGTVLVGPTGMTLYTFTKDTPGTSTCTGDCATAWPPLTVKAATDVVPGLNLQGKFDTLTRDDKSLQVTYNGMPLYYFSKDKAIGDAMGEGVGKVWASVVPETVAVSNNKDQGNILVSFDGMTLYTYAKDTAGTSTCTGDCAKAWPPFTVDKTDRLAAGKGVTGKLDTIKLDDNNNQVTYNGMPLYVFSKDKAPGDAAGQNVGNVWSVVKP